MPKIKTSELTGVALAWAVAKAESLTEKRIKMFSGNECPPFIYVRRPHGKSVTLAKADALFDNGASGYYHPHTSWGLGGPLIEREGISLTPPGGTAFWMAQKNGHLLHGSTPLIAACRCLVASKLGDKVDVPEELE